MDTRQDVSTLPDVPNRDEIARLIKQLGHWRFARRYAAVQSLRKVGPDVIGPLMAAAKYERRAQAAVSILWGLFLGLAVCLFNMMVGPGKHVSGAIVAAAGMMTFGIPLSWTKRKRECALSVLKGLTGLDNPGAIGPLIEALEFPGSGYKRMRWVAQDALASLIPHLTSGDADQLAESQWVRLYLELLRGHAGLKLAILKAVEQTGDVHALPYVRDSLSLDNEVMAARASCLSVLQQRAEQQRVSRTLLRPSVPETSGSELVRPVASQPPTEHEQLLRIAETHDTLPKPI